MCKYDVPNQMNNVEHIHENAYKALNENHTEFQSRTLHYTVLQTPIKNYT